MMRRQTEQAPGGPGCRLRLTAAVAAVAVTAAVCAAVYACDPAEAAWMPKCVFKSLTGYDCPACGSTRALHHLLHGDLAGCLGLNPFVALSWPFAAVVVYHEAVRGGRRRPRWYTVLIYIYIAAFVAWWVVRNVCSL